MEDDKNQLADLFQYDEIYWVPADRLSAGVLGFRPADVTTESNTNTSTQNNNVPKIALNVPEFLGNSFDSSPSLDGEASKSNVGISTPWLVIGYISELEKTRLNLIFSAPPLLVSTNDWSIYEPKEVEPVLLEFIKKMGGNKFLFIGQQPAIWQSDFQVTELAQIDGKFVYFFPRMISTLTDADKSLKLVFWNALKSMI